MKRIFVIVLIVIVACLITFWGISIAQCEILTFQHGHEFEGMEETTNMLSKADYFKVLSYSDSNARVFYKSYYNSNILEFMLQDGEWVLGNWQTVWSRSGSADDFMWPYIRQKDGVIYEYKCF